MIIKRTFSGRIAISMTDDEAGDFLEILTIANNIRGKWPRPNRIRAMSKRIQALLGREVDRLAGGRDGLGDADAND